MEKLLHVDLSRPEHYIIPAVCALTGVYVIRRIYTQYSLPPGPIGLPVVGNLLGCSQSKFHLQCDELAKKYGPITSIRLGQCQAILLSDYDVIKEMFSMPVYTGRINNPQLRSITKGCGIVTTDGDSWSTHRRFSLQVLRDFGFAKTLSAEMINVEAARLTAKFDEFCSSRKDGITEVANIFTESTNNVIANLTFGKDPEAPDDGFKDAIRAFQEFLSSGAILTPGFCFPILGHMPWLINRIPAAKRVIRTQEAMQDYIQKKLEERKEIMKDNVNPECLCDAYIQEQEKREKQGDFETFKDFQIVRVCVELFAAGSDTTARSLEWLIVYMATYTDVQDKVYQEVLDALGEEGRVQMSDKTRLHYTMAVMDETYRKVSLAATGVPHRATEDTYFHGYFIPKDSTILALQYSLSHNEKYFPEPHEFQPERFLDDEGHYKPSQYLIPFLIGKRSCLGESLARMELFLFFVSLMQKFKVELHNDCINRKKEILTGKLGVILGCYDYKLNISRR